MKRFKSLFFMLFLLSVCANAQSTKFSYKYKKGDPRNEYFSESNWNSFPKFVARYENFREPHENVLKRIGQDTLWIKEVDLAKKNGGYIVEAVINPDEEIELCMSPADMEKVTHLKLTGRAYKWGEYESTFLINFVNKLKNLKVLNLRDLDCELLQGYLSDIEVPKLILPANCKTFGIGGLSVFSMKEVVFNNGIEAIAHVRYGTMGKSYSSTSGLHTLDMKNIIIPEGVEYIGGIYFHEKCETLTLPSSLIEIGEMKPYSIGFRKYDLKNLKKIRINRTEPPSLRNTIAV